MTTITPLPSGQNWEIVGHLSLFCPGELDPSKSRLGLGIWVTKNRPYSIQDEYNYNSSKSSFGFVKEI